MWPRPAEGVATVAACWKYFGTCNATEGDRELLLVVASPKTSRDIRETRDYSESLESKIKIYVEVAP